MEVVERHFFPKQERLCLKREINSLFDTGLSFVVHPLRVLYASGPDISKSGISILISVPKKRFKHAVKRNRIKRLIRETYRLNNDGLKSAVLQKGQRLQVALMYISNDLPAYKQMETGMIKVIKILENKLVDEQTAG
ncbi:MAG: ribonuclease P protein component [Tannerella sp.]|jgi:ribonuclease P protein component|nr:ribonuclease P protein component [Tannerella sp.]